jgi:hypothetical protein
MFEDNGNDLNALFVCGQTKETKTNRQIGGEQYYYKITSRG